MEAVLELVSINGDHRLGEISVFHQDEHPFLLQDVEIPHCNTGFVYMIVSTRDPNFTYIGTTRNLHKRLSQHNSGRGSKSTVPLRFRPYALFAFICGFDDNKELRYYIEYQWKRRHDIEQYEHGNNCPKQWAKSILLILNQIEYRKIGDVELDLRLILNFKDD